MSQEKNIAAHIGVILLAAGSSSRLGRPKQLLSLEGTTLLQHSLQAAIEACMNPVIVVLGAHAGAVEKDLAGASVQLVLNPDWQEGMAASIRCGIQYLQQHFPEIEGAILMVCDQPFVSASLLHNLIIAHQDTQKPIITCSYANTFGPPTLFHKTIFPELVQLKGDVGARSVLKEHAHEVEAIFFPEGNLDIDTEADYQKLSSLP